MTCPVCGTVTVPGARFCHACGNPLSPAAALPTTERRVVTVLFGDLSDFTAWAEDVDPERVGAVTDRVLAALAGAVKTFGGHVDKLTGDGIMAVFGAPVAHEDDAERAVRAAFAMQRAVRRVLDDERGGGAPLGLRVGLNTGDVVAGVQAGVEYTVIGDTVNTAARLADASAVGAVYAGEATTTATRRLAAWRQLRPLRLKGKRQPVQAYELLGLLDAPGTRSGLGDEAAFVGRETELGRFAGRLAEVADRADPRVMVLTAEAGIGKSRFGAEAGRYAADHGARLLSVRCAAYGERRRLAPLADLVRAAIGLSADNGETRPMGRPATEERLRRLAVRLSRDRHTPRLRVDLLLALLGYGELPAASADRPGDGADADAVPNAVADLMSALAAEAPLVVVVDDLHDATPESVDALGVTLSRLAGPVLVLLLGRPELVRPAGVLTRLADAEVHTLPPLRGADAARLLSAYLGGGRLPQADEDRLLSTAQGNPFYLAELVTLLLERGLLTGGRERGWRLAPQSLSGRLLSRDLAAVLAARIDALPAEARAALRDAAVIGDTVPEGALEALRARPGAVAAVALQRAIDELLNRRMLRRVRGGYAFATPLMRQAAYAGVGKADLAERHARLVRWAAPAPQTHVVRGAVAGVRTDLGMTEEELDAFIGLHAEWAVSLADQVGLRADADARTVAPLGVAALLRLARRALSAAEPGLVVRYCERAARLEGGVLPAADRLLHARALLQLGRAADALSYAEKIIANATDNPAVRVPALLLAGNAQRLIGDADRAGQSWREALAEAETVGLPALRAEALRRLGMADYLGGRFAESAERFEAAYRVSVEAGDRRSQAWSMQHLAWVTTSRGDFEAADTTLARAARLFAEIDDPIGRAWVRGTTAFGRLLAGRLAEARRLAKAFLPFGERVGERWAVGTLRSVEAFAAAELGELAEADREARRAYRDFAAADDEWGRALAMVVRGVVARGLGDHAQAIDIFTDAESYGVRAGHPLLVGMARTIRGYTRLEAGDPAGAEADARSTLDVVEPFDVHDAARVGPMVLLGQARRCQGDLNTALKLLGEVANCSACPSLLFPRRQAVAHYAATLHDAGQLDEALHWARRAVEVPAEDIRSRVVARRVLARVLAAGGDHEGAREAASEAVALSYATQQVSERHLSDLLAAEFGGSRSGFEGQSTGSG